MAHAPLTEQQKIDYVYLILQCTESAQKDWCTNSVRQDEPRTNGQYDCRRHPTGNQPEGAERAAQGSGQYSKN
eukprot:11504603-Ditylum_brightwellii.AAC.1